MLIPIHEVKLCAHCYTWSEAHARCETWSEALCSMLYKE